MALSQRLSARDVRKVCELVGEVREFGDEPTRWRTHALDGLCRLIGGQVGLSIDFEMALPGEPLAMRDPIDVGWDRPSVRQRYFEYLVSGESADDPGTIELLAAHQTMRFATWFRRERVDDERWYSAPSVSEARRTGEVDDFVATSALVQPKVLQGFVIYRPWGARPFAPRERRIARLFHAQVLRLIRVGQAPPGDPLTGQPALSPRLRQTLEMLLTGDSMKQIAAKLGLSPHTVNDYTKALYKRFDVSTRAELINRYHAIVARQRGGLKLPTAGDA